ncbi:hypothetical protein TCE0_013f01101 [Talaromyces pinophilus]|uniref:Uncharacterized protein n=1 Tax=Talaromyces pinophilus TaxID=128442 RepID=A0A698XL13_TALPI|nr:hypothetical protein TCE0_013f01101 [Talaromyces pinophilus]
MGVFTVRLRNGWRLSQSSRLPAPRYQYQYRSVATKQASPGVSSNVINPQSSNPESQSINISRGKEARHSDTADSGSVASPVSSGRGPASEAHQGEEQTETDSMIKNDPRESAEKKRRNVESAGRKSMGPEDQ